MSGNKKDRISIKRLASNVLYVLKYALKHNKKMALSYIIGLAVHFGIDTIIATFMLMRIINQITLSAETSEIMTTIGMIVLLTIIRYVVFRICENYFETKMVGFNGEIQRELMEKAKLMDLKFYDIPEYYDDFIIAASQSEEMCIKAIQSVGNIIASITSLIIAGTMILTVEPIIVIFPVIGFLVNIITRFKISKLEYEYNLEKQRIGRKADYSKRVFYQPEYAKEVKLTGIEEALMEQYDEAIAEERKMAMKYSLKIIVPTLINWITVFTLCQFYAVPVFLAYLAIEKKSIQLGEVASLKNATNDVKSTFDFMNYALVDFQEVGQYAEKFRRFMDAEINIEGCKGDTPIPENDSTLEIRNVGFKYKDDEKYVLKNINMTIRKGEKLALVGENGAGKSTLIKLIMRLYDVTEGEILFGGVDIRRLNIREYREKIGTVFQDFQIYGATLGENVCTAAVGENEREEIVKALERADFGDKLKKLEDGIDTELTKEFSDKGTMLSGGEGQKVAIARMFMRDMPIAIFDEPSSALDPVAEYRLNKSMLENAENQAVVLISHRLSTTKDADRIILLENGSIAESGTHSELMEKCGSYAKMWTVQAEKYAMMR